MQTVQLDSKIKILDSPGIVFHAGPESDSSVALKNAVRVGALKDPVTPAAAILQRANKQTLVELYSIPEFNTPQVSTHTFLVAHPPHFSTYILYIACINYLHINLRKEIQ